MENKVIPSTQPATLAIRWRTIAVAALGVCVGMVIGAVGVQQAIKQHPIQLEMLTAGTGTEICINGFAYEVGNSEIDSPWHGVYRPLQQGQEPLIGEGGEEVLRQVIPVRCKIGHG
ncbi:hypothetical protein ACEN2T_17880 [Pseudomonas sp. W22_MBD1_FP4]|uniref:hypothetical protein n=1 Tax=Pseudomonas sp. W22_MBD1_FP4 TaxID=3240272 RepID=UPI003F9E1C7A